MPFVPQLTDWMPLLAAGRELVAELLSSPCWERVRILTRRPYSVPEGFQQDPEHPPDAGKLQEVVGDLDHMRDHADAFRVGRTPASH